MRMIPDPAKKRRVIARVVLAGLVLLYAVGALAFLYTRIGYAINRSNDKLYQGPIGIGDRILIVAPHPDDEDLAMGGLIYNETRLGKKIKIVVVTNGDAFTRAVKDNIKPKKIEQEDYIKLGSIRQKETISAMHDLGFPEDDIIFLGYSDGSINSLWEKNWDYDEPHSGLNGYTKTPYEDSFDKNAVYCGQNLVKDLWQIINDFKPTDIFYPDPDDMHHDHWAVGDFVKFTVESYDYKAHMYSYLVHHYQWPEPWALLPTAGLYPPLSLENVGTNWHIYKLDRQAERAKGRAVREYTSQFKVMGTFMDAFIRRNELFGTYEDGYYEKIDGKPDFKGGKELPYKVMSSGVSDNPLLRMDGGDDIKSLGFVRAGDEYYFGLETRGNLVKITDYTFNAIFMYKDGDTSRLKVSVKNFKALKTIKGNGINLTAQPVAINVYKNRMWFSIFKEDLGGDPQKVFLNATTSTLGKSVDKTAYRMVKPKGQGRA